MAVSLSALYSSSLCDGEWPPFANKSLPMQGGAFALVHRLLCHQSQRTQEGVHFGRHLGIVTDLHVVYPEDQVVLALIIGDFALVALARLRGDVQFVEITEIFGPVLLAVLRRWHARKGQPRVDSGYLVIAHEDIQRQAILEIEQIDRDEAVVEIARRGIDAAGAHHPLQRDGSVLWRLKLLGRKIHVLGVVENLHLIVAARQRHGGHAQPITLYDNHRVWLAVLPERAIRQRETAILPGGILACNNRAIVAIDAVALSLSRRRGLCRLLCLCLAHRSLLSDNAVNNDRHQEDDRRQLVALNDAAHQFTIAAQRAIGSAQGRNPQQHRQRGKGRVPGQRANEAVHQQRYSNQPQQH